MLNKLRNKISTRMFNGTLYNDLNKAEKIYIDLLVENTLDYEFIPDYLKQTAYIRYGNISSLKKDSN